MSIEKYKDEWWFPVRVDAAYFERLRKDYPDKAELDDEDLADHFEVFGKYATTWGTTGDAYGGYEKLADAFFQVHADHLAAVREARREGLNGLTWEQLVERAVDHPAGWERGQPRWSAVGNIFSVGSTTAHKLCRRFDQDPDELRALLAAGGEE